MSILAEQEHRRAELERLRAGYDGCGCATCQEYYQTIDLEVYGDRVKRDGDTVCIIEGKKGADLWDQYHGSDYWTGADQVYIVHGQGYAVAPDGRRFLLGAEAEILEALNTKQVPEGATPLQTAEYQRIFKLMEAQDGESGNSGEVGRRPPVTKQRSDKRSRPLHNTRHIDKHTGQVPKGKRITIHKHRPQQQML